MGWIDVEGRKIGPGCPCFIIAEAGVNHNGDIELAKRLVDVAGDAGVDAIKFQTFRADQIVSRIAPKAEYQLETTDTTESQLEMLQRLELSHGAHRKLYAHCRERGVLFMSTPFDEQSANLLYELGVPVFKIGSGEITDWPLLEYIACKGRPIILSTGMSYLSEVDEAVRVIRGTGNERLALLHCVSSYPADPADANLRVMQTMAAALSLPVGYSDHTPGIEVALAAVALGACIIEKHFTLDRSLPGPDHRASLEPDELVALVKSIRTVEVALGHGRKEPSRGEANTLEAARKSLVAAKDIAVGTVLTEEMIAIKRPGTGLSPSLRSCFIGRTVRKDIKSGVLFSWEMLT